MTRVKKNDVLLILLLLLLGALPLLTIFDRHEHLCAQITVDGTVERVIDLSDGKYEEFDISTTRGRNSIKIENGAVSVHSADCPDKICVKSSPIRNPGEIIACLPHKLLIEIKTSAGR